MSTKQESVSDTAFKAWQLSSNFTFASKDHQVTAATCKYCPLVASPTATNCCKEPYLKCGKIIYDIDLLHQPALHPIFSYWVG